MFTIFQPPPPLASQIFSHLPSAPYNPITPPPLTMSRPPLSHPGAGIWRERRSPRVCGTSVRRARGVN